MIEHFPRLRRKALDAFQAHRHASMVNDYAARFLESPNTRSFLLPEGGEIIDKNTPCSLSLDSLHLPFPEVALEYSWSPASASRIGMPSPASTIILAIEQSSALYINVLFGAADRWLAWPVGAVLDQQTTIEMRDGLATVSNYGTTYGKDDDHRESHVEELQPALVVLAHFALLCNCGNVRAVKAFEPSAALVKRAKQRGNRPPDEYYVLDCFLGEHQERGDASGGSHSPPRFHVRRGHIRRLPDGRHTWVKQCTVGDAALGQIMKDYRVRNRQMEGA
jgi:hypothetical protein